MPKRSAAVFIDLTKESESDLSNAKRAHTKELQDLISQFTMMANAEMFVLEVERIVEAGADVSGLLIDPVEIELGMITEEEMSVPQQDSFCTLAMGTAVASLICHNNVVEWFVDFLTSAGSNYDTGLDEDETCVLVEQLTDIKALVRAHPQLKILINDGDALVPIANHLLFYPRNVINVTQSVHEEIVNNVLRSLRYLRRRGGFIRATENTPS
jgi:hypothetical protein